MNISLLHVIRGDILGHYFEIIVQYFGTKIYYDENIFFSVEKVNKLLIGPKQFFRFFLSLPIEKENNRFSSPNIVISSPNIIPDDMKKTIINT